MKLPNWLLYTLVLVITAVWVTSFAVSILPNSSYDPPESINLLFSSVIGGLLLGAARKGKGDDDDKKDDNNKQQNGGA